MTEYSVPDYYVIPGLAVTSMDLIAMEIDGEVGIQAALHMNIIKRALRFMRKGEPVRDLRKLADEATRLADHIETNGVLGHRTGGDT